MPFTNLFASARKQLAKYRQYRQVVAEIDSMSERDLLEIGAFQADLYRAAREQYLA